MCRWLPAAYPLVTFIRFWWIDETMWCGFLANNGVFPGVHYLDDTRYPMYLPDHGQCPAHLRLAST